jgi:putative hydrolase of the HAD superfamily
MKELSITDIFFDLDHTLWDFDRNSKLAFGRVFQKHKIQTNLDDFLDVYLPINLEYWRQYREERISKEELRLRRLGDSFSELKMKFSDADLNAMAITYIDELPVNNHLFSDALDVLEYLFPKYRLHIITNGFYEVQHKKIENSNIGHYFSTVTTSEDVGVKKPNPLVFQHALQKANATPETSVMIGDSFEADVLGAEKVGLHTVFFNYRNETVTTDHRNISTLNELMELL